jgi:4-alpha-glucanotransferase
VLSTRVLYFGRTKSGAFVGRERYPARALVSANTHDMAPLVGFWQGRDLELRRAAGILESDEALAEARAGREREKRALLRRLRADRLLPADRDPDETELVAAVHAFLAGTPAALVGISLDDLAQEPDPVNLPGVGSDGYPSWMRRLGPTLAELRRAPDVARALAGVRRRLRPRRQRHAAPRARRRRASG